MTSGLTLIKALRRYPLWALLDMESLNRWIAAGQFVEFVMGETIFQEGTFGEWAYLVADGQIRAQRITTQKREATVGVFGPGDLFGEYALLSPGQYTATCRAMGPCRLLALPLEFIRNWLPELRSQSFALKDWLRLHTLVNYLRGRPFLGFMTAPSALKWLDLLATVEFRPRQTIQDDGCASTYWFFVEEGSVTRHANRSGIPTEKLSAGDCFGEDALLARPQLPLVVAETSAKCLYLSRDSFTPDVVELSSQSIMSAKTSYPWVGQKQTSDCGLAALAMALRYHGLPVSVENLRLRLSVSSTGVSMADLADAAETYGVATQAVRIDASELVQVDPPTIMHLRSSHYVTLFKATATGCVLGDPATGIVSLSLETIRDMFSKNALILRMPNPSNKL